MNFHDVELLSSYLDGQLNPSDSTRLETRLASDPSLRAVLDDLRAARGLLHQLPARKAPRNFTLTPKMVGLKPPMPRTYPVFRFATAFAALLLLFTFAVNELAPRTSMQAASAPSGFGMGGAAPLAATEAPLMQMEIAPTATPAVTNDARIAETAMPKAAPTESLVLPDQPEAPRDAPVSFIWQIGLAFVVLISGVVAFILRRMTIRKWQEKNK